MNSKEFKDYIEQIQNIYHKELTSIEADIWYENLKFMSIERFNYILSEIYKTNKFMPTLADILQVHRQIPYTTQKEKTKIKGNCLKCDNTGYVSYFKQIDGRQYIFGAVCDCGRQERFDGRQVSDPKNKSDYYMPTIEELGLEIKTTRPSDAEIIKSMNMLKKSNIVSEEIKNIIRENFRKRRLEV